MRGLQKKEHRQKGPVAILEASASVAEVKGDHPSSWHSESHFPREMWWLDSREDSGDVRRRVQGEVGLHNIEKRRNVFHSALSSFSVRHTFLCLSQQQPHRELPVNNDDLTRRHGSQTLTTLTSPFAKHSNGILFLCIGFPLLCQLWAVLWWEGGTACRPFCP